MELKQSYLRTDVTSLLLFKDHLLSGMGGILTLFNTCSLEHIAEITVFEDSRIHGICEGSDSYFVIFGGKRISIVSCNLDATKKLSIESCWNLEDWIQSVQWLEDTNVAVATSHNRVTLWNWKKKESSVISVCQEKCIVYCATFVGDSWDHLVLLVGTVFREVVIWSPAESSKTNFDCTVLQRLQGHKGVIFSIHFNSVKGQIHSTSDDRSIRGWQMKPSVSKDWKLATFELLYVLYGHTARVWKSIRLKYFTLSVGEDSQVCVWSSEGKLIKQWSMHQGGNIWSLACCEEKNLMVTGGSDGAINILSLEENINCHDMLFNIPVYEWCSGILKEKCIPRRVAILSNGNLVSILESGHLLFCPSEKSKLILHKEQACSETKHFTCSDNSFNTVHRVGMLPWILSYYSPQLASYCLLEVSGTGELVALASLDGQILIFKETNDFKVTPLVKIIDISACTGKIFSLQWLSSLSILTCEASGKLTLWSVERKQDSSYYLMKVKTFLLPNCKERWVTAALHFDKFLVCGDRLGSIHLYFLGSEENEIIEPCQTLSKVHGRFGVSSFMSHRNIIYSTGRDGTLQQYEISEKNCVLKLICATKMLFDWVASSCTYANDILVLGFSEKKFVVWSQQQQRLLFEVPCGGGHRSWDYLVKENALTFVHIKHKSLYIAFCDLTVLLKPLLQTGFHAKEVNCLLSLHGTTEFPLFLSGGEDTAIRVTMVNSRKQYYTLVVLHSHISSVKALTYSTDEDNVIVFSAGGRAQIKAWKLTHEEKADDSLGSPSIRCRELSSHMLMDVNHKQSKPWKVQSINVDPETRYMSLCVIPHKKFFVAVGCSDGYLRLFQFHIDSPKFQLVDCFGFHHRCILNVILIAPLKLATMATDGIVAFWDLENILNNHLLLTSSEADSPSDLPSRSYDCVPFASFQVHQSGINCCALKVLECNHILVASGGDDTAFVLSVYKLQDNPSSACLVQQWRMESAHVAQITGVAFADKYVISTSVDQYVFMWKWICNIEDQLLLVNKVAEYYTIISDIHGLSVRHSNNNFFLTVYGKGMEIIEAKSASNNDSL